MPFVGRTFAPRDLPGRLRNRSWLEPTLRLSATELVGFVWNPSPHCLPVPPDDGRVYVHIVVRGRAHALALGRSFGPGEALVCDSASSTLDRDPLAFVDDHQAIALRLDRARLPGSARGSFALPVGRLLPLHAALLHATDHRSAVQIRDTLLDLLAASGLAVSRRSDLDMACELAEQETPHVRRVDLLASGLTKALTVDSVRPALIDLNSEGLSATDRHLRRQLRLFMARYRMPFASWRELRQSFSLTTAALSMSAAGARTDAVSRAAGFASPSSMCHAFARGDLGSPQELADRARELRKNL